MPGDISLADQFRGLDTLEAERPAKKRGKDLWAKAWPPLVAVGMVLLFWQLVVWSGWKPEYVLPGPVAVLTEFATQLTTPMFWHATGVTMSRAVIGFAIAAVAGLVVGVAISRWKVLRAALASLVTGLQTMPSIAWFPLAILLFQLSEQAILFVIILGAAPSVANGVISGVDYVSPQLLKAGKNLGAKGLTLYRMVILPAALPSIVGGLKQGWAFAWRSLMAGELIVAIANRPSLGAFLSQSRELGQPEYMLALMIAILLIGIVVDIVFAVVEKGVRNRRGVLVVD